MQLRVEPEVTITSTITTKATVISETAMLVTAR